MKILIQSARELQKYVRVNSALNFDIFQSFLRDAQDKYIIPYIGQEIFDKIVDDPEDDLREYLLRALGPFAMALSTDEFSINFGESGHTVARSNSLAPASDAKIEKATESLFNRGWSNLDNALKYLESNKSKYPAWTKSPRLVATSLFEDASEFQEKGLVDIDYSPLAFSHLRVLIIRIENSEAFKLLPVATRTDFNKETFPDVTTALQAYTGSRVAALHTSQSTRVQRGRHGSRTEFKPTIRPLYEDLESTGNYFDEQAAFWRSALDEALVEANEKDAGEGVVKWNNQDRRIFVANAGRS